MCHNVFLLTIMQMYLKTEQTIFLIRKFQSKNEQRLDTLIGSSINRILKFIIGLTFFK